MENNDSRKMFVGGGAWEGAPIVVADGLRTPENVGNIVRLMGNIGATELWLVLDEGEVGHKEWKVRKTACMAIDYVRISYVGAGEVLGRIPEGYSLVGLETSAGSRNIFETELPGRMVLVVGSEVHGIRRELLDACEMVVHIPMLGAATSMNVSHAAGVAMFEFLRQRRFK